MDRYARKNLIHTTDIYRIMETNDYNIFERIKLLLKGSNDQLLNLGRLLWKLNVSFLLLLVEINLNTYLFLRSALVVKLLFSSSWCSNHVHIYSYLLFLLVSIYDWSIHSLPLTSPYWCIYQQFKKNRKPFSTEKKKIMIQLL